MSDQGREVATEEALESTDGACCESCRAAAGSEKGRGSRSEAIEEGRSRVAARPKIIQRSRKTIAAWNREDDRL